MRYYSSIAVDTALTTGVASDATTITVNGIVGYPTSFPFTICLDPDTAKEELCDVTNYSGSVFTVTRGVDSTTPVAHAAGAAVRHVITGRDLREAQQHIAATTSVHGIADTSALATKTGSETFTGKTLTTPRENWTVAASSATGTVNFDAATSAVVYYTSEAAANWTLNFRGAAGTTLSSLLDVGSSITVVFLNTNGSTAYYPNAFTIDGTSVTPKWDGGSAPTAGSASAVDSFVFTIVKTSATPTYSVFATTTKFA